jgi:uncharacterized protein (UPF0297 family)
MALSFEDEEMDQVTEFKIKKKENLVNPNMNKENKIVPVFLSSEDREKLAKEELRRLQIKEKDREKAVKDNMNLYLHSRNRKNSGNFL